MAPNAEVLVAKFSPSAAMSCSASSTGRCAVPSPPPQPQPQPQPQGLIRRAVSDLSSQVSNSAEVENVDQNQQMYLHRQEGLPNIPEAAAAAEDEQDARCECCGMSEACTPGYIRSIKEQFCGQWVCGLCAEAVKEELRKPGITNGQKSMEDALAAHMAMCVTFNKFGRRLPVLAQAEAMKEILKKRNISGRKSAPAAVGCIIRSSSCMPAISREIAKEKSCSSSNHTAC